MFRFLKRYFVPHPENGHHPHILRTEALLILLAATFAVQTIFLTGLWYGYGLNLFASIVDTVLVDETNASRIRADLPPLTVSPLLEEAARLKAEDMAKHGYFAHTSPAGVAPWDWFRRVGYAYIRAGENLAVNFVDSEDVIEAWLRSPKHRENIMNGLYEEIGIGTARGTYEGQETVFIVQLFGAPRILPVRAASAAPQLTPESSSQPVVGEDSVPVATLLPVPVVAGEGNRVVVPNTEQTVGTVMRQSGIAIGQEAMKYASAGEKIAAKPRLAITVFYLALATLVLLALTFVAFMRTAAPHPHMMIHSVAFITIIGAVILANQYVVAAAGEIF